MTWAGHVACKREENALFRKKILEGRNHHEDRCRWRIILKLILNK
jgi:hypothetical protein